MVIDKFKVVKSLQHHDPYSLSVERVIHVTTRKGDGTLDDPVRFVEHFYDIEGHLLFETE